MMKTHHFVLLGERWSSAVGAQNSGYYIGRLEERSAVRRNPVETASSVFVVW